MDWERVVPFRRRLLEDSFRYTRTLGGKIEGEVARFANASSPATWLADWTLFAALRERNAARPWTEWDPALARREAGALSAARADLEEEIAFHAYAQFLFFRQWQRVKAAANARGISIFGDLPIYVARDSADVWAHPRLFALDEDGRPTAVAGVPPDYFSATGQLWGNPLYRWDASPRTATTGGSSAIRAEPPPRGRRAPRPLPRLRRVLGGARRRGDGARRALGERAGPQLFMAIQHALGDVPLVAEDLGLITDDVRRCVETLGFPG